MYELNFVEQYDNLSSEDKLKFQKSVTRVLSCTYINRFKNDNAKWDEDYLFLEERFEMVHEYLAFAGYELSINKSIGVISVQSQFSNVRKKLDKETTLYILTLRMLFEEKTKEFSGASNIVIRVSDFIDKLLEYGIKDKKPNLQVMAKKLRFLATVGILEKQSGRWDEVDTLFIIYPAILLLLPQERLNDKLKLIEKEDELRD